MRDDLELSLVMVAAVVVVGVVVVLVLVFFSLSLLFVFFAAVGDGAVVGIVAVVLLAVKIAGVDQVWSVVASSVLL